MANGSCLFCLGPGPLVKSHIIPRSHLKAVKNIHLNREKCFLDYTPEGECRGSIQDFHERLFCKQCEEAFNKVEKPYLGWWGNLGIEHRDHWNFRTLYSVDGSGKWSEDGLGNGAKSEVLLRDVDVPLLKKMHLINLFRIGCIWPNGQFACDAVFGVKPLRKRINSFLLSREPEYAGHCMADVSIDMRLVVMMREDSMHPFPVSILRPRPASHGGFAYMVNGMFWILRQNTSDARKISDMRVKCVDFSEIDYPWQKIAGLP